MLLRTMKAGLCLDGVSPVDCLARSFIDWDREIVEVQVARPSAIPRAWNFAHTDGARSPRTVSAPVV